MIAAVSQNVEILCYHLTVYSTLKKSSVLFIQNQLQNAWKLNILYGICPKFLYIFL